MKSLFLFEGRITRTTFWVNSIIGLCLLTVLIIGMSFFGVMATTVISSVGAGILMWLFIIMASIATLVAGLVISYSAMIRRFHDRDKSGWWSLISFIPWIGGIWILIDCGCLPGTNGPNRFGPDSLASQEYNDDTFPEVVVLNETGQTPDTQ